MAKTTIDPDVKASLLVNDPEHLANRPERRMFIPGRNDANRVQLEHYRSPATENGPNSTYYTTRCECQRCEENRHDRRREA